MDTSTSHLLCRYCIQFSRLQEIYMQIHIVSKSSSHTLEWRRTCSDRTILSVDRLEEVKLEQWKIL